jgi:hypothetical protein
MALSITVLLGRLRALAHDCRACQVRLSGKFVEKRASRPAPCGGLRDPVALFSSSRADAARHRAWLARADAVAQTVCRAGLVGRTLPALSDPANARHADGAVVMSLVSHTIVFSMWRACRFVDLLPPVRSPVAARERRTGTTPLAEALRMRSRCGQRNQRRTQCRHARA